ncbi:hypothetical protein VQ643_04200 [Pseudomonas sp. F1_0610]|uniref:hypothetical protein n=1 Tax=Pseudomonas sp. F1_0610 TaxID=3114284 RepID=UPI0039C21248
MQNTNKVQVLIRGKGMVRLMFNGRCVGLVSDPAFAHIRAKELETDIPRLQRIQQNQQGA